MDQKTLKDLEARCVQEEPPPCTARCPIHVDVRLFLKDVTAGHWDKACRTLNVMMPFSGIIARICDHPCENVCLRTEAGGAISVSELERAAVIMGKPVKTSAAAVRRDQRVAVVGSGLSSLTVGFDLVRKGYGVVIFEPHDRLGGNLWTWSEDVLPGSIIHEEVSLLENLGCEIRLTVSLDKVNLDTLTGGFHAVYVGADNGTQLLDEIVEQSLPLDPQLMTTSQPGVFAGGGTLSGNAYLPIYAASDGRKAATSIDRYLQNVSMTAGRQREGSYVSKLYTSLDGVQTLDPVRMEHPESGYSDQAARDEATRCLQCECMECVKYCLFMEKFKGYPKRYVRQISNDATIVLGAHGPTRKLVNSCTLCGLCTVICPYDFPMADACMDGRKSLVNSGKMPGVAHEFALDDMMSACGEKSALTRHEPGMDTSRFVFFPGCQLSGIYPKHVRTLYDYLKARLSGGVGLSLRCCGMPAKWAARVDLFNDINSEFIRDWEHLGKPTLIAACPTCYTVLKEHLPLVDIVPLWRILNDIGDLFQKPWPGMLAVHDPCTARHEHDIQASIRALLERVGCTVEELSMAGQMTECCGYGGLVSTANPELAKKIARKRAQLSSADYVTYCAMCRNALAAAGKRVIHILDLLFPGQGQDPAKREPCGLSERRENRYHLKEGLLRDLWRDGESVMENYEQIILRISDEVRKSMEDRRILTEDVQKVIDHAERSGTGFFNVQSGRTRAFLRPANATYWVDYSKEEKAYRVHSAYLHRMEVTDQGTAQGDGQ